MTFRSFAVLVIPVLALAQVFVRPTVDVTQREAARVRAHLATVEAELRGKDVSALTPTQRDARARNLDALHAYWVRGAFPVNTDFPGRQVPYFVDHFGTRCAMAYLIEQGGGGDLVARIAAQRNNAYIRDLKDDVELVTWLRDNGLTAAEAARIQPAYASPVADFAGRWKGKAFLGSGDSVVAPYLLSGLDSLPTWTLTLANRAPIPLQVVWSGGDSLVMEAGPQAGTTMVRNVVHYGGDTLTGTIEVRYASGAVTRGRIEAVRACPGPTAPEDVVTFVRDAGLSKVRCVSTTGSVLGGRGTLFVVTHHYWPPYRDPARRIGLRWRGRVGWILDSDGTRESSALGAFRARRGDTLLVAAPFLKEMTVRGLRLAWATTLLANPDVPRFVPLGLIAALQDTVDEGLAAVLVAAPRVTRDPEMLVALARLPVAPDSSYRTDYGGGAYSTALVTVRTGYGKARDQADLLLWKQADTLIAAPGTAPELLLWIATWRDRHLFWCVYKPEPHRVFAALRARAIRDGDRAVLAALARVRVPCD